MVAGREKAWVTVRLRSGGVAAAGLSWTARLSASLSLIRTGRFGLVIMLITQFRPSAARLAVRKSLHLPSSAATASTSICPGQGASVLPFDPGFAFQGSWG